ncbi:hypothetical protein [Brevibacillus sp. SYSU BS000544]|uniref:hypothetical protein n=1 Tax=Brevibacillus sp. SYSU BS000544 TaxID=3416443 RepID=UPI003CE5971E
MLKKLFTKASTPHKVIARTESGHVRILKVYSVTDGMLETEMGMYPVNLATTYHDELDGGLVYFFELTHEAMVEAEQLKHLQRQVVLSKIFQFDTKSGAKNIKDLLPYAIAIVALLAK